MATRSGSSAAASGVLTVIVDTPERMPDWFAIVDELTAESGLVTGEIVRSGR